VTKKIQNQLAIITINQLSRKKKKQKSNHTGSKRSTAGRGEISMET
jgi:hypothetical protein